MVAQIWIFNVVFMKAALSWSKRILSLNVFRRSVFYIEYAFSLCNKCKVKGMNVHKCVKWSRWVFCFKRKCTPSVAETSFEICMKNVFLPWRDGGIVCSMAKKVKIIIPTDKRNRDVVCQESKLLLFERDTNSCKHLHNFLASKTKVKLSYIYIYTY